MSGARLPKFCVVVDSNALFPRDTGNLVSPKFDAAWKQCLAFTGVELLVPEVVMGERLYQLVSAATRAVENAHKNFDTLGKISGHSVPQLPTNDELRRSVETRFVEWVTACKGRIVPVPFAEIDWKRVVADSIWRNAPFARCGEHEG
jgi:hypothetical protein